MRNDQESDSSPPTVDVMRLHYKRDVRIAKAHPEIFGPSEAHIAEFAASGISVETMQKAGVYQYPESVPPGWLADCNHDPKCENICLGQALNNESRYGLRGRDRSAAWAVPHYDYDGEIRYITAKLDKSYTDKDGSSHRYAYAYGQRRDVYFPPGTHEWLKKSAGEIFLFSEAVKNALAAAQRNYQCCGVSSINGWCKKGTKLLHESIQRIVPELRAVGLVVIVFDNDIHLNEQVAQQAKDFRKALRNAGVPAVILKLPPTDDGSKLALDILLARPGGEDEFKEMLSELNKPRPSVRDESYEDLADEYIRESERMIWYSGAHWTYERNHNCYCEVPADEQWCNILSHINERYEGSTKSTVNETLAQINAKIILPSRRQTPCWIHEPIPGFENLKECMILNNGLLSIRTRSILLPEETEGELFNTFASDVYWDSLAREPKRWLAFLDDVFGDDNDSKRLLQETFGYLLMNDTGRQVGFGIVGPPGCGKGTIVRTLMHLMGGDKNVVAADLTACGDSFGKESFIGKSLIVMSEVHQSGLRNNASAVEFIKSLIGEDDISINRKNRSRIACRLSARLLFTANELPSFPDSSGAFERRFILLNPRTSCPDKKVDHRLGEKLKAESTGILNWAIEGAQRLLLPNAEFTKVKLPEDEVSLLEQMVEAGSPVKRFAREICDMGSEFTVRQRELYSAYECWCMLVNEKCPSQAKFSSELCSALQVKQTRPRVPGSDQRVELFAGIKLKPNQGRPEHIEYVEKSIY